MFAFILTVFLFNLMFLCLLYLIRHMIAITTPVLIMTALVAFLCTTTFPYMIAILDYTQLTVLSCFIILFFSVLLTLADKKYPVPSLGATVSNHPSGNKKQIDNPNTANETVEMITATAEPELPEQNATAINCADAEQIPNSTTEIENTAKDRETAEPQSEFIPPVHEVTDSFPDETDHITESPDYTEVTGYVEIPEQKHDEQLPAMETMSEPESFFVHEEDKNTPTDTNQLFWDSTSTKVTEPDSGMIETIETIEMIEMNAININKCIELGFASKQNGDYIGAARTFFKVFNMQPEPKLAALLAIEISDIYRKAGQLWQATEILNIAIRNWRTEPDTEEAQMLGLEINQLLELLKKGG